VFEDVLVQVRGDADRRVPEPLRYEIERDAWSSSKVADVWRRSWRRMTGMYGTRQWKRLRLAVLYEEAFVCGYCGERADRVDHVVPVRERPDLAYVRSNLKACCRTCNAKRAGARQKELVRIALEGRAPAVRRKW